MTLANQAKIAVPRELADLAEKYILQATVQTVVHRKGEPTGHVDLQVQVHPFIYTAVFNLRNDKVPIIYFEGNKENSWINYVIGMGREETLGGGVLVHVHYEDFSRRGSSIIEPLKAEYQKVLGRPMPMGQPWGRHDSSNELFRHVPGSLEEVAQVVFTTMKEHTKPVQFGRF